MREAGARLGAIMRIHRVEDVLASDAGPGHALDDAKRCGRDPPRALLRIRGLAIDAERPAVIREVTAVCWPQVEDVELARLSTAIPSPRGAAPPARGPAD